MFYINKSKRTIASSVAINIQLENLGFLDK